MIVATVTVDDYIAAHRLHYRRRSKVLFFMWSGFLVAGTIVALSGQRFWAPILVCVGLGGLFGHWWDERVGLPRKVRKLYGQFKGISEPTEISWNAEVIEARGARGQAKRKWKEYVRFKENDQVFLLYVTDQLWEAFPKSCLNQAQLEEFRRHAMNAGAS